MFFLFIAAHLPPDVGAEVAAGMQEAASIWPGSGRSRTSSRGSQRCRDVGKTSKTDPTEVLIEDGIVLRGQGVLPDRFAEQTRQLGCGNHLAAQALCPRTCGDRGGSSADQIPDTGRGRSCAARRLSHPPNEGLEP